MYLEMIFGKNKEQTMRQLQFKFDPFPPESTTICLFHQRWIKTFFTQPFCQLCIIYGLVFYKIDLVQFCNKYMVGPSQKKFIFDTWKIENEISVQRKWNFPLSTLFLIPRCTLVNHMISFELFQDANLCKYILFYFSGHKIADMILTHYF